MFDLFGFDPNLLSIFTRLISEKPYACAVKNVPQTVIQVLLINVFSMLR